MFDFSQVTAFAAKLADAADTDDVERGWKKDQADELADAINPPVHTGALAGSVRATADGVEMLEYWRFLEYGTSRMAPRPFVRPAVQRRTGPAVENLGDRVLRELL